MFIKILKRANDISDVQSLPSLKLSRRAFFDEKMHTLHKQHTPQLKLPTLRKTSKMGVP